MKSNTLADKLCEVVAQNRDIPNATARIAAWLVGTAQALGGFPVELTYRQVKDGFTRGGIEIEGTGSRHETVKAAFEWLEEHGYLTSTEGKASGFGHVSRMYTLEIEGV